MKALDGEYVTRIIPARAGFTIIWTGDREPVEDHPRSRGVYGGRPVFVGMPRGSSPLARGLRKSNDIPV